MELKQGRDFILFVLGQSFMEPRLAPESVAKDNLELLTLLPYLWSAEIIV